MIWLFIILSILLVIAFAFLYQRYQERKMKRQLEEVMNVFEKIGGKQ